MVYVWVPLFNDTGRWFFAWWHDMVDEGLAFNIGRNPNWIVAPSEEPLADPQSREAGGRRRAA